MARAYVVSQRTAVAIAKKYEPILTLQAESISAMIATPTPPNYRWGCGSSREAILALAEAGKPHRCFD
jgi:hypothetical protein